MGETSRHEEKLSLDVFTVSANRVRSKSQMGNDRQDDSWELSDNVAGGTIFANIIGRLAEFRIENSITLGDCAADLRSTLPDDLGEMRRDGV